ncbi:MAG TPA: hypothetical protein VJ809_15215 [Pirellulales bacterium]|nr:hypothetical protein [Pirellulales bacterium]
MAKRTTHRSKSGSKLYAERGKTGRFGDIQTFERAHERDVKRNSKAEGSTKKSATSAGIRKAAVKKK